MNRFPIALCLSAVLLCVACGRRSVAAPDSAKAKTTEVASLDLGSAAQAYADSVVATMTTEEMVAQLLMPASYVRTDAATIGRLRRYVENMKVGGVAFHKGTMADMRLIADSLQHLSDTPLFLAIDAENGLAMRLEGATAFPVNCELQQATQQQMYDYGLRVGRECESVGVNMVFDPVLDVARGKDSYMYRRSLGTDAEKVAELGTAKARGLEDSGVMPVGKHFPGHGATTADSHAELPVISDSAEQLYASDLKPFMRYVELGFPAIMAGHIAVPLLSGDSVPADLSPKLLTGILRNRMGFDGLIITDALTMGAVGHAATVMAPEVAAILAGADIILAPADTRKALDTLVAAARDNTLPLSVLRDRCRRILFYKYLYLL